jgi:hypothetical protein
MAALGTVILNALEIVGTAIWTGLSGILTFVTNIIDGIVITLYNTLAPIWDSIAITIYDMSQAVMGQIDVVTFALRDLYNAWVDPLVGPITDFIGNFTGPISDFIEMFYIRELFLAHDILSQVWEDYRKMIKALFEGANGVFETIGIGARQLAAYFEFTHASFILAGAVSGQAFATSEIRWMQTWAAQLNDVARDVEYYQGDPSALISRFNTTFIEPMVNQVGENQTALYKFLKDGQEAVDTAVQRVEEVDTALKNWVESAPDQWRDDIREVAEPLSADLQSFKTEEYHVFRRAVETSVRELKASRDRLRADVDKPGILAARSLDPERPDYEREMNAWDRLIGTATVRSLSKIRGADRG